MLKFKDKKEEQSAIEILKQGAQSEFWQLILKIMQESKEDIQAKQDSEDMKDLSAELYKSYNELFKAKKELIDTLMKTPENIISWLAKPQAERPKEFDPYDQ